MPSVIILVATASTNKKSPPWIAPWGVFFIVLRPWGLLLGRVHQVATT